MSNDRTPTPVRTDDLLASGADSKDGAQGFKNTASAAPLTTGMEGIVDATGSKGNRQSDSQAATTNNQTVPDNPGQLRNKQGST